MQIAVTGLDLAKNVFQVHGIDDAGQAVLKRKLRRSEVLPFFAGLDAALVGIEACHTAHYWGREIAALGHDVRLMPPQSIAEAVQRPTMRFVPIKSADQQAPAVAGARCSCDRWMAEAVCYAQNAMDRAASGAPAHRCRNGGLRQQAWAHRLGDHDARKSIQSCSGFCYHSVIRWCNKRERIKSARVKDV